MIPGSGKLQGSNPSTPVAIIGIGCMFPKADHLEAYWANIKSGKDAITSGPEETHWNITDYFNEDPKAPDKTYAARGGFLSPLEFDPLDCGISPFGSGESGTTSRTTRPCLFTSRWGFLLSIPS